MGLVSVNVPDSIESVPDLDVKKVFVECGRAQPTCSPGAHWELPSATFVSGVHCLY